MVVFRDQKTFVVQEQRELGMYWGSLHRHATTAVPVQGGLEDIHVVWADEGRRDARSMFSPGALWHSDASEEFLSILYKDSVRSWTGAVWLLIFSCHALNAGFEILTTSSRGSSIKLSGMRNSEFRSNDKSPFIS